MREVKDDDDGWSDGWYDLGVAVAICAARSASDAVATECWGTGPLAGHDVEMGMVYAAYLALYGELPEELTLDTLGKWASTVNEIRTFGAAHSSVAGAAATHLSGLLASE